MSDAALTGGVGDGFSGPGCPLRGGLLPRLPPDLFPVSLGPFLSLLVIVIAFSLPQGKG